MSDNLCPVCGAANRSMGDKDYTYWACGRVVGPDGNEAVACSNAAFEVQHLRKACEIFREQLENAHRNIGAFRAQLALHEASTRLLDRAVSTAVTMLMQIGSKVAPHVAGMDDQRKIRLLIEEETRIILDDLTKSLKEDE